VDAEEVEQHCDAASAAIKVAYHVIGNAVPPTFGRALAQAILAGRNTAAATGKF
jgi:site-specific DNA-cytosine methylase